MVAQTRYFNIILLFYSPSDRIEKLSLTLSEEPHSLFYKDEGGKSNFLIASCTISSSSSSTKFPIGNLKLSPRLIYESGAEIEDESEIFNILSIEPKTVTSTNEIFTVNFRIEKVSRRKDGKRFRVRFDVDENQSQVLDYVSLEDLSKVKTQPITVLSKRKNHHAQHVNIKEERINSRKRRTSANVNSKTVTVPLKFIKNLAAKIDTLENTVSRLEDRIAVLERKQFSNISSSGSPLVRSVNNTGTNGVSNTESTVFTRGQRVHSLMFDQFEDISTCRDPGIKRNASSTTELFELLAASSQVLN